MSAVAEGMRPGPDAGGRALTTRRELPEPAPAQLFERRADYPWFVVGAVCIGAFMGQVDASIVQLALPSLESAFDAQLNAVSWVAVGYVLAFASALPVFARLAEIAGRKTLYLGGFAFFALWSAFCGLAPDLPSLIAFRILQGVGGALAGANSVVILVAAAGPARRGKALGIMAAAQAVGLSIGPAAGGLILGTLGWRWIFWVTVPFGALGFILAWLVLPKTTALTEDRRLDAIGAILLIPATATLLLAITEWHAWGLSPLLVACVVAAPLLLGRKRSRGGAGVRRVVAVCIAGGIVQKPARPRATASEPLVVPSIENVSHDDHVRHRHEPASRTLDRAVRGAAVRQLRAAAFSAGLRRRAQGDARRDRRGRGRSSAANFRQYDRGARAQRA
jgi:MFS family permease